MIVVCDIDGTLADNSHRIGFLQTIKKDWDSFYDPDLVYKDRPIKEAKDALKALGREVPLYFLTGRPRRLENVTRKWMNEHFELPLLPPQLLMRKDGDYTKAVDYKEVHIKQFRAWNRLLIIDDDERNFEMYRKYGLALKAPECWKVIR